MGLRTRNERHRQMEPWATAAHTASLTEVPPGRQVDGMWVTIQQAEASIKPEQRQRQRKKRSGKKRVVLVALGFWPDGKREIIDWQMAEREDHHQWEVLVPRLWERGCGPENGLQVVVRDGSGGLGEAFALGYGTTVPEQRCLFHQRQTVSKKACPERKGKENQEPRTPLMGRAATLSQAYTASEAHVGWARWAEQWREHAPQSVATLERDVAQTLVCDEISGLDLTGRHTTSLLERPHRE